MSSRHRGLAPSQLLDGPGDTVHILAFVRPYGQLGVTLAFSPSPLCTFSLGSYKVVNTSQPVPRCSTFNFNLRYVHFANSATPSGFPPRVCYLLWYIMPLVACLGPGISSRTLILVSSCSYFFSRSLSSSLNIFGRPFLSGYVSRSNGGGGEDSLPESTSPEPFVLRPKFGGLSKFFSHGEPHPS